jgi:SagB-type dehydrogenase family enzyme
MSKKNVSQTPSESVVIKLPNPKLKSSFSLEEALMARKTTRNYSSQPVTLPEVSQLLWAAQGITRGRFRSAPSAGALYPLEIYVTGKIDGLGEGTFHYLVSDHSLAKVGNNDLRKSLYEAAYNQRCIIKAPILIAITCFYSRVTKKYGEKGVRYTHLEVGHVAQNIHLQVENLNLGTVCLCGFDDNVVKNILNLSENEDPIYLMPIGHV